jgi:DNA-binding XRE family transcriptional regulator
MHENARQCTAFSNRRAYINTRQSAPNPANAPHPLRLLIARLYP